MIDPSPDQFKELLDKNLAASQEILKISKKIKRYLAVQQVVSVIYFLIIVVPIILGIIYLPSLLEQTLDRFMPQTIENESVLQNLLNQYLK